MKVYNVREVTKILKANGFIIARNAKSDHQIWANPTTGKKIPLPATRVNRMLWQRLVKENNINCNF